MILYFLRLVAQTQRNLIFMQNGFNNSTLNYLFLFEFLFIHQYYFQEYFLINFFYLDYLDLKVISFFLLMNLMIL